MKYISILMVFICYFLVQACIRKDCKIPNHDFEIPATLSPAKDTFNIGDTITISSVFPNQVYDKSTEQYYKLENFRFYPEVWITKIHTVPVIENLSGFEFIVDSVYNYNLFCYSDGSCSYYGEYNYSNQEYSLYYKIVLQSSGLYRLSQGSAIYPLGEWQDFEGKCWNVYSDVSTKLNDGIDNNVAFLNNSPDPHYNDWILQEPDYRFHRGGGYCFYVRE